MQQKKKSKTIHYFAFAKVAEKMTKISIDLIPVAMKKDIAHKQYVHPLTTEAKLCSNFLSHSYYNGYP